MARIVIGLLVLMLILAGCGEARGTAQPAATALRSQTAMTPIRTRSVALSEPAQPCSGSFVAHDLDHITGVPGAQVRLFEGNGSGVAIDDLDGDGDLDIVLANQYGADTILWNEGRLSFRTERMADSDSRAVNVVDVDGDNQPDIVFTQRTSAPHYWHNTGATNPGERFVRDVLPRIYKPANAMNWGDLDGDGDLDLVAASYDAGLLADMGTNFLLGSSAGVYLYERNGDSYAPQQLARAAQALAIAFPDLNGDGAPDIVVGNDFAVRDQAWVHSERSWVAATPFATTSHSTMSLDQGDIDNNGDMELFATDMKPYRQDVPTLATWQPFMAALWESLPVGDPQIMANTLQVRQAGGTFREQAYKRGIDATGWSWSGKFGDLDGDGFLDLYVVNGMIEAVTLSYLPNHELVEQNQALRNDRTGSFVPAPAWGLGSSRSGRGMTMADLDSDGDLDIVVNNLRTPAQLFENRLCGGSGLEVELSWPASKNTRALGARLALHTSAGVLYRDVRAASGYLSGDPARVHFGVPAGAALSQLDIQWPDGATSTLDRLTPHTLLTVTRN